MEANLKLLEKFEILKKKTFFQNSQIFKIKISDSVNEFSRDKIFSFRDQDMIGILLF
jgi:hypothetical protein